MFYLQNGRQSRRSQIDILSFIENIRYKANFTLPSDTNIVHRYVLLLYSIILLRSDDRGGTNRIRGGGSVILINDRIFYL